MKVRIGNIQFINPIQVYDNDNHLAIADSPARCSTMAMSRPTRDLRQGSENVQTDCNGPWGGAVRASYRELATQEVVTFLPRNREGAQTSGTEIMSMNGPERGRMKCPAQCNGDAIPETSH